MLKQFETTTYKNSFPTHKHLHPRRKGNKCNRSHRRRHKNTGRKKNERRRSRRRKVNYPVNVVPTAQGTQPCYLLYTQPLYVNSGYYLINPEFNLLSMPPQHQRQATRNPNPNMNGRPMTHHNGHIPHIPTSSSSPHMYRPKYKENVKKVDLNMTNGKAQSQKSNVSYGGVLICDSCKYGLTDDMNSANPRDNGCCYGCCNCVRCRNQSLSTLSLEIPKSKDKPMKCGPMPSPTLSSVSSGSHSPDEPESMDASPLW